jgi:hypothetical protein
MGLSWGYSADIVLIIVGRGPPQDCLPRAHSPPSSRPRLRIAIATMQWHHPVMNRCSPTFISALLCLAGVLLSSCAGKTPGERFADMPHWMGGEPAGVPPRRGTPEYDAWTAARASDAARPKAGQKTDQAK